MRKLTHFYTKKKILVISERTRLRHKKKHHFSSAANDVSDIKIEGQQTTLRFVLSGE